MTVTLGFGYKRLNEPFLGLVFEPRCTTGGPVSEKDRLKGCPMSGLGRVKEPYLPMARVPFSTANASLCYAHD